MLFRSEATIAELAGCLDQGEYAEPEIDWAGTATELLVKIGEPALPVLEARLAEAAKVEWEDGVQIREEGSEIEEKRLRAVIRRIRAK